MTKYTAADFANARFAEHPDGRIAVRFNIYPDFPWTFNKGAGTDEYRDVGMARFGWVPVPTKPQITESQYKLALDEDRDPQYVHGFTDAMHLLGGEVIPDPEPTNKDRIEEILKEVWTPAQSARTFAEYLDELGVTAPNVKGN